ncbi:MAG: helix-turn-helix transcriptional regulator [Clostridiales bacterium]|nr:helix-turn-helix transcriptional regulator [Clostridiales bacterium]
MQGIRRANRRLSVGFALSYLVLLVIPLVMGAAAYLYSTQLAQGNIERENAMVLAQCAANVEGSLSNVDQFAVALIENSDVQLLLSSKSPSRGEVIYLMRLAIDKMPKHYDGTKITDSYFIADLKKDVIVSPGTGYTKTSKYFTSKFAASEISYPAWYESIYKPEEGILYLPPEAGARGDGALMYVKPYTLLSVGIRMGTIVFVLSADAIRGLLEPAFDSGAVYVCMADGEGNVLVEAGERPASLETVDARCGLGAGIGKTGDMLTIVRRERSFVYLSATPVDSIASSTREVLGTVAIGMVSLIAAELMLGVWMLRRNHRPLVRIINNLPDMRGQRMGMNGLKQIETAIRALARNRDALEERLFEQRDLLRNAYVDRLLHGDIIDESEAEKLLEQLSLRLGDGLLRGVYMRLRAPAQALTERKRAEIVELLRASGPGIQFVSLADEDVFTLVYCSDGTADDAVEVVRALYARILSACGVDARFYLGQPCAQLKHAHHSFASARALMQSVRGDDDRFIVNADDAARGARVFAYSLRDEQQLVDLSRAGDVAGIVKLLDRIRDANVGLVLVDDFSRLMLYYRMLGTLLGEAGGAIMPEEARYALQSMSLDDFFAFLRARYVELCRAREAEKMRASLSLVGEIEKYVGEHFRDSSISLYSVALQFGLTESYLSTLFKDKLGENFSVRIERLRIEEANRLLKTTDESIAAIAERVGYVSANTFRRAFRRVRGFSPSSYRNET